VVTGIIGMVGNIMAMKAFREACFDDIQPRSVDVTITKQRGAALICLIVVTLLKLVDIAAHLMVPAARGGEALSHQELAKRAEQMEVELAPLVEEVVVDRW
jgi:hypothetical protein